MARLFGTDGVRGLANELLTADMALDLSQAAAIVLGHDHAADGRRPRAVLARDGRASGEFLGAAVAAGPAAPLTEGASWIRSMTASLRLRRTTMATQ